MGDELTYVKYERDNLLVSLEVWQQEVVKVEVYRKHNNGHGNIDMSYQETLILIELLKEVVNELTSNS